MKKFLYKAKNGRGQIITGTVRAENEIEAEKVLMGHNFIVMDLSREKTSNLSNILAGKVSSRDKAVFARQLSTMISAGLELPRAIKVTSVQARNDKVRGIILDIYKDLEEGNSFSGALGHHPEAFDPVFISVVAAGEATGKLDVVLKQLAEQLENDNNFIGKIKGAMYYPAFILIALVGIAAYMMIKVIPQLKGIFDQAGASLPVATKMLLWLSDFTINYWWLMLIIILISAVFLKFYFSSDIGGKTKDRLQLRTPGVRNLFEGMFMYRFTRVMAMLIGAGVPLLDALKISGATMNNSVYEISVANIIGQVEKGVPLSVQLSKDPVFPQLIGQMAAVGEETGRLDQVFDKVADYYEETTDQMIKTVSTLIEPAVLVLMGVGVAFLVFAVLVPIYQVSQMQ